MNNRKLKDEITELIQNGSNENLEGVININNPNYLKKIKDLLDKMNISSVFKYRSFDKNNLNLRLIKENTLWISDRLFFNDPFEFDVSKLSDEEMKCIYGDTYRLLNSLDKNKIYEIKEKTNKDIQEIIHKLDNGLGVCSFCENKDNMLLWSHYADSHKGFCIEYDLIELLKKYIFIYPVIYSDKKISLSDIEEANEKNRLIQFIWKAKQWEYEREWRAIVQKDSNEDIGSLIKSPKPKNVYLGCCIEEENEEKIISVCKEKRINCFRAIRDDYEYKLNFEKVIY